MKFPEWLNKLLDEDAEDITRVRASWNTEGAKTKIIILIAFAGAIIDTIRAKSGQEKTWAHIAWSVIVGVLFYGALYMAIQGARLWAANAANEIIFSFVLVACMLFTLWLGIEIQKRDTRIMIAPLDKVISGIVQDIKDIDERRTKIEGELAGLATRTREARDERKQLDENERAYLDEREELYKNLGMKNGARFNEGTIAAAIRAHELITGPENKSQEEACSEAGITPKTYRKWRDNGRPGLSGNNR